MRRIFLKEGATLNAFNHHFTQRTIKVIFDGALGSRGAALLRPYNDAPETSGYLTEKPESCARCRRSATPGIKSRHTQFGDRANRMILDLYGSRIRSDPT